MSDEPIPPSLCSFSFADFKWSHVIECFTDPKQWMFMLMSVSLPRYLFRE